MDSPYKFFTICFYAFMAMFVLMPNKLLVMVFPVIMLTLNYDPEQHVSNL